ncbi:hypothetical protein Dsin_007978 [Dipteronia sinensis]|uniref:Alliinase C-terminal domain-containing protein n=1 Tax=Dipteronia sinensis TaxID=43782 RepID=A0AAE0B161_9ROSI|nr:hypothetical protein Dsin_007978 [Dipteronia sinensis]
MDHDLMLFTVTKTTGHAGMRIGKEYRERVLHFVVYISKPLNPISSNWAIVKDTEVAQKMTKYIELSTFGVSRNSKLPAAKVLKVVSKSCEPSSREGESFFEFSHHQLARRWELLRLAVQMSGQFSLPEFSPQKCIFFEREFKPQPAFAWLNCEHQKAQEEVGTLLTVLALYLVLKFLKEMEKIFCVLSVKQMLLVSIALNVSLFLRVIDVSEKEILNSENVDVSKNMQLFLSSSSSLFASTGIEAPDGWERVINLDRGDPLMYEKYWQQMGDKTTIVIPGWQSLSYFSNASNICWFMEPKFAKEVVKLHKVVGNAITENRHIVVGTGSSQLFQAALYALSAHDASKTISVVSASPYHSAYPSITDFLKSGLYKWAGDAHKYKKRGPYIEIVTSPNNPDGFIRQSVVNRSQGILVHDLAYYWPQYTSISFPANHDLMLFTVSTITGHAGMRIGWAIVKDKEVAKKMTKYIELNTLGVSRDSQLRAAKVLKVVSKSCTEPLSSSEDESFFEFNHRQLATRWKLLRLAVQKSGQFSLPEFSPQNCTFLGREFKPQPAFAWLKCEHHKISSPKFSAWQKKTNWVARSMIYLSVAEIGSGVEVGDCEVGKL